VKRREPMTRERERLLNDCAEWLMRIFGRASSRTVGSLAEFVGDRRLKTRQVHEIWMQVAIKEPPHLSDEFWDKFTDELNKASQKET
jgi:hypothetical protein